MTERRLTLREVQDTDTDLQRLAALLATMDDEAPLPLATIRERYAQMRRYPDYRCWFMVDEHDVPLGTFSLLVFPVMVHDGRPEAVVESVVVSPSARGMGIGKAMMKEAMRLSREAGAAKLALSSNARRLRAHDFYRSLGFTEHGISFSTSV